MKKLKISALALFLLSFLKINAGCCGLIYVYDNSFKHLISLSYNSSISTFEFNPTDTFIVKSSACGCDSRVEKIYRNDTLIYYSFTDPLFVKLPSNPGLYKIQATVGVVAGYYVEGTFIIANKLLHVGINEYNNANQWLSLFPNPSKESVTVNSFEENLKSVAIYNLSSELIEFIETADNKITIPLSQYPQGVYIVKVATLSDKIAIKKLIVSN